MTTLASVQYFDDLVLLAATETTEGTDPTPATSAAILTTGATAMRVMGGRLDRNAAKQYSGNDLAYYVGKHVELSATVEIAGSGAAGTAPHIDALMQMSKHLKTSNSGVSTVYTPQTRQTVSGAIYFYHGTDLWKILGCMANGRISLTKDGIPSMSFTIKGRFDLPEHNASPPAATFANLQAPIPLSKDNTPTASLHTFAMELESFEFEFGTPLNFDDRPGGARVKTSGRRMASGSITFVEPYLSAKDFYAIANARTTGALQIVHGITAGKIWQFDAAAVQLMDDIEAVDLSGEKGLKVNINPVFTAEGNGYSLTWK